MASGMTSTIGDDPGRTAREISLTGVEWRRFDYADKAATAPPADTLVWINELYYAEGVTVGYFDGSTMRVWGGSDDCSVTHWAPIELPPAPAEHAD